MVTLPALKPSWIPACLLLIALITGAVFAPSLSLPIRDGDQIGYFSERNGSTSVKDGLKLMDYGLTRKYAKGDEILFRPLQFAWLAFETKLFSYHAPRWNLAHVALHLLVFFLIFGLFYTIQPSLFAFIFSALLAVFPSSTSLPLNHHLGGYLLGQGLYLAGLILFYSMALGKRPWSFPLLLTYAGFTSLACFFYELVVPFSLLPFFYYLFSSKDKSLSKLFLLMAPAVLYVAFYLARDFSATNRLFYADEWASGSLLQGRTLSSFARYAYQMTADMVGYVVLTPRWQKILFAAFFMASLFPALFSRTHSSPWLLRLFPLAVLTLYIIFLSFMRSGVFRDYYTYLFYLLAALFLYGFLDFSKLNSMRGALFAAVLVVLTLLNFSDRCRELFLEAHSYKPMENYFNRLVSFMETHRGQPGFSFAVQNPNPEYDPIYELKPGYPDGLEPVELKSVSEILFAPFFKKENPRFILTWNEAENNFGVKNV